MFFNKKGSHVGTFLSFGIFVAFLVFIYISYISIFPGFESKQEQEIFIKQIKPKILQRISSDFTVMSVMNNQKDKDCIVIENYPYEKMGYILVKNTKGELVESELYDGKLIIKNIASDNLYKIYSSDFGLSSKNIRGYCPSNSFDFEIGINRKERLVSAERVSGFIKKYRNNYSLIKKELNISEQRNFGIDFIYSNGTMLDTETTNLTRDIFVVRERIEYYNKKAEKKEGYLRIKSW